MYKTTMDRKAFIFLLLVLFYAGYAQADTIYLKNGPEVKGIIKSRGKDYIEVEVSGGVVRFNKGEVAWVVESSDAARRELREKWRRDNAGRTAQKHAEFTRGEQGIIVDALINGKINAKLILDTGASLVVLRKGLAKELEAGPLDAIPDLKTIVADGRESKAKHIVLRSVKVGNSEVENVDAAILVDETQQGLLADGLLGMSFLKHFDFRIDQKQNKLILEKARE